MHQSYYKSRARFHAACSATAILAAAALAPVAAQAQESKGAALEEVVVTARKVSENLQNVPVAVTAFSAGDLERQNATKLTDIGRLTPGINFRQSSTNPSGLLVSLRGQFQRDVLATQDPSVGLYVDGVYWARSYGANSDLVDLQSAQVLKGPQGTLFGRNTTGGAVLLQTNDPQFDAVSGMVSGAYGRFNERIGTAVLNLPVNDKVALRGALQINQRDGYIRDAITGARYDNRDNITGRVKLGIRPTERLNFVFSAEAFRFKQAGQARALFFLQPGSLGSIYTNDIGPIAGFTAPSYIAYVDANRDQTAVNAGAIRPIAPLTNPPDSRYETRTYSGLGTLETGIGTFKLITAYRSTVGYSLLDLDGSPWSLLTAKVSQDLWQRSAELQLTGKTLNDTLSYVGGLFYFSEEGSDGAQNTQLFGDTNSPSAAVRASAAFGSVFDASVENSSKAVYGQFTYKITSRLNVTGGLRYSVDNKGVSIRNRSLTAQGAFLSCGLASLGAVRTGDVCTSISRSNQFESASYLASADYRFTDGLMAYVRFDKGFRSGGQNARATNISNLVPFAPEIVHDVEVGVKSELFDRRLRLNVAAYHSTIDGAQRSTRSVVNGTQQTILGNAAKVRVDGLEAEATAVLGGGFRGSASLALTRPKYLSYRDITGDLSAQRFNDVPRTTASVMGAYERDLSFGRLYIQADYSWASATPLDEYNTPTDPFNAQVLAATTRPPGGEANVRATLTLQDGRYELSAYGKNIADNRDKVTALQLLGFGFINGQYREPATYGVQATYRFGR